MSAFEAVLAAVIIVAAVLQLVVLFLLYRVASKVAKRAEKVLNVVEPELANLGPSIRQVRQAIETTASEVRSISTGVRTATDDLMLQVRETSRGLGQAVDHLVQATERQIDQVELSTARARQKVEQIGAGVDRAVLDPVRSALAVAVAVRRGIETFVSPGHRNGHTETRYGEDVRPTRTAP
ncbi:MAG: hypothetical protein ACE15D_07395 [Candidatus Eisenbacteria bacterium]